MTAISCSPFSGDRTFPFSASKLFSLARVTKLRLETLPRDAFLWFANFF